MRLLIKLPTRSRPEKAISIINEYARLAEGPIQFLLTCDEDDPTMNNPGMVRRLQAFDNVKAIFGQSLSKIHAINRDLYQAPDYDILVLASDDMICQVKGWDTILKAEMATYFHNLDGVLFHWDGDPATARHNGGMDAESNHGGLNTMCIMGKKAVERFGYIYNPEYTSLFCDNEFTEVWDMLGKQKRFMDVLFKHEHFSNTPSIKPDQQMMHTQSFYRSDEAVYKNRKQRNFGL